MSSKQNKTAFLPVAGQAGRPGETGKIEQPAVSGAPACRRTPGEYDGCSLLADPELEGAGWQMRFIVGPERAREAEAMYRETGFEVRLEPVPVNALADSCEGCKALFRHFFVIYTRK